MSGSRPASQAFGRSAAGLAWLAELAARLAGLYVPVATILGYVFLFAPLVVLVVYSSSSRARP